MPSTLPDTQLDAHAIIDSALRYQQAAVRELAALCDLFAPGQPLPSTPPEVADATTVAALGENQLYERATLLHRLALESMQQLSAQRASIYANLPRGTTKLASLPLGFIYRIPDGVEPPAGWVRLALPTEPPVNLTPSDHDFPVDTDVQIPRDPRPDVILEGRLIMKVKRDADESAVIPQDEPTPTTDEVEGDEVQPSVTEPVEVPHDEVPDTQIEKHEQ